MPAKKKRPNKVSATKNKAKKIPALPEAKASREEIEAYFAKYPIEELEKAGMTRELTDEEMEWVDRLSAVAKEKIKARKGRSGQLNLAMPAEQLDRFNKYAAKKHIPPSTLARAWILERLDQESKEASS